MADPFASFFNSDDPVKAILNFGKQGGTYSDQALQFLGQQAQKTGGMDAFFKFGDIASQYSNKGIDSAGAADQIARILGVEFGGSGRMGYGENELNNNDGGNTTNASATAEIGTGNGSGATTDWNAVYNQVMGDINANPNNFRSGTGINNYRTSEGYKLIDLPQDVQARLNTFLGSNDYMNLLGQWSANDPGEQLRRQQEADEAARREAEAARERERRAAVQQPVQSSGNNMTTTSLQADSTALGGQMQRGPEQQRSDFLGELVNRDAELQANQQAQLSEYVNQANRAGIEGYNALNLPSTTTLSPLEQAVQGRLQQRVGTDNFLSGIDQSMGQRAEDLATRRIQQAMGIGGILGQDQNLQNAIDVANQRLMQQGDYIDPSGQLTNAAEKVVMDRLLGGDNPLIQQQRANYLAESADTEAQLRENLNRMGVLRSGDTADVLGNFLGQRDRGLNDINATAYNLQSQALADALGLQSRRDQLAMANQDLRRAAISDVAGLSQQALGRQLSEQDLQRGALSDALGLQQRRDTLGLANQDLQRAALSDALGYQQMSDERARAEAGQRMQGLGLQQDIADRTLNRLLTQTAPTQREIFAEQMRQNQIGNVLAQGEDIRAGQALESDLTSADLQRRLAEAGVTGLFDTGAANQAPIQTLQAQELGLDRALREAGLTGMYQGRQTMAGQQLADALRSSGLQRELAEAEATGVFRREETLQSRLAQQDILNAILGRQATEAGLTGQFQGQDTMAGRALTSDLSTADLQRRLSQSANQRSENLAQQDILNAILGRTLQTSADQRAGQALESDLSTADLQRRLSQSANQRSENLAQQDILNAILGRTLQKSADQRAGQALESDLATAALQRTLSRSADARAQDLAAQDILNAIFGRQMQGAANTRANQALQSDLFGMVDGQQTLSGAADVRAADANTRANQALQSDLYGMVGDQQTLSGYANQRAEQMLMDALFGRVGGQDTLTGEAAARADAAQARAFEEMDRQSGREDLSLLIALSEAAGTDNRIFEALTQGTDGSGYSDPVKARLIALVNSLTGFGSNSRLPERSGLD